MAKQPTPSQNQQRRIPLHGAPITPNTPPPAKRDDEPEHQVVVEDWDEEPATPAAPAPDQPEKVTPPIDVGGKPLNKVPAKFRKLL